MSVAVHVIFQLAVPAYIFVAEHPFRDLIVSHFPASFCLQPRFLHKPLVITPNTKRAEIEAWILVYSWMWMPYDWFGMEE
jgi:hypothetical protein